MAASVLLGSADNTGLNFTVGGGSSGGSTVSVLVGNNNGLGPAGPAPWNRSLDRALDEASATGCLNLSGRKLKEFPRSAANHDLTDTTRADLSRNRLSELPPEVCLFVSLESLNLYQNCLRSLPDSLINLQALTYLNLSLPLKVLIACNNKLVSLPEELGQLRHLTELVSPPQTPTDRLSVISSVNQEVFLLVISNQRFVDCPLQDVSCNEIQTLPAQVGQLETLRDLNIRRNHLVRLPPESRAVCRGSVLAVAAWFSPPSESSTCCQQLQTFMWTTGLCNRLLVPSELADLPLVRLDFSCNKVTSIPVCYRQLTQLQTIVLDNNPLQTPPAQICIKGKIHIFKYLNLEASKTTPDLPDYDRRPLPFSSWSAHPVYTPTEELSELSLRVAEVSRDQRPRGGGGGGGGAGLLANGTRELIDEDLSLNQSADFISELSESEVSVCYPDAELEQIDFIDSCVGEEDEEEGRSRGGGDGTSLSSQFMAYIERRITRERGGGVERMRREAQLAALRYDEERQKNRSLQSYTKGEDRAALSPTANQSPSYPSSGGSCRTASLRPESFLFRLGQKEEKRKGDAAAAPQSQEEPPSSPPLVGEDAELVEQLRKPKLTMAKCRRNVENFLEACRRIGVPQSIVSSSAHPGGARAPPGCRDRQRPARPGPAQTPHHHDNIDHAWTLHQHVDDSATIAHAQSASCDAPVGLSVEVEELQQVEDG
ncbi:Leucine-rich repeat and calponin-like proteiny domain-containing protein 3 [Nibea albiflora]|uniref:Leucine-rich repeat and calponin-like proteiny domain-containing protein 3 n=1 Tax=Nibea albiflora TaxID=240163 RepID=A0ACB7EHX2_NIBAL|nr:Leucine-rich repeat and calponin-like proteiny domain-containing protein 3 [Nibea albiflora]